MSSKFNSSDKNNIIQLYQTGKSINDLSTQFKCAPMTIYLILKESNVVRTKSDSLKIIGIKKRTEYSNEVIKLFNEGKSVQAISNILKIQRRTVNKTLHENGIKHRNRSESMYNRMKYTSIEEKYRLTNKMHTEENRHVVAYSRFKNQSMIGAGEIQFKEWMVKFGYNTIQQFPIGRYNIDIMIENLAVEIYNSNGNPIKNPKIRKRAKYILNNGFHILYIQISPKNNKPLTINTAIYTISLLKYIKNTHPINNICQVIESSGKLISSFDSNDFN